MTYQVGRACKPAAVQPVGGALLRAASGLSSTGHACRCGALLPAQERAQLPVLPGRGAGAPWACPRSLCQEPDSTAFPPACTWHSSPPHSRALPQMRRISMGDSRANPTLIRQIIGRGRSQVNLTLRELLFKSAPSACR